MTSTGATSTQRKSSRNTATSRNSTDYTRASGVFNSRTKRDESELNDGPQMQQSQVYFDPNSKRYYRYLVTDNNVASNSDLPPDPNSKFQEIRRKFAQPKVETIGLTPAWNLSDQKWDSIRKWSQNVSNMQPDAP